jgi:DNA-binding CsgD family transcriptional regulator
LTGQGFAGSKLTRFESWLAQTLGQPAEKRSAFSDTFEITRKAPQARYSMQCCTLEPSDPLFDADAAHHIVFVTDPEQLELPTHTQTQSMLGLTPAEARVALALVQTGNYNEVASDLGVSVQTVRSQAKSIYAKTQVNNKGALTRLMLSLSKASV